MEIYDEKFDANEIKKVLITIRNIMHYPKTEKFSENIKKGIEIQEKAIIAGDEAVKDY
ncbi:MAG: hypothetical protein JSS91_01545 [Bacteroidetes bacterium]|nr:hypothetical protein [Bacteroidota bacterium]